MMKSSDVKNTEDVLLYCTSLCIWNENISGTSKAKYGGM